MTITELLNQTMPGNSLWENLIYAVEDEFRCIESVPKVQRLLGHITGHRKTPSAKFIRQQLMRNFTG